MENKKKTLVIIPAYNEESSIAKVIADIKESLTFVDILVVNDGSNDATGHIAKGKGIFVLNLPYNLGIGAAMQAGYKFAKRMRYEIAIRIDGDGQHPINEINNLIEPLKDNSADIVIGSRYLEKTKTYPFFRKIAVNFLSRLVSCIIKERVTDVTSGFVGVNKESINLFSQNYPYDYPEAESIILAYKYGFRIKEIPVSMNERASGISSIGPLRSVYYMFKVTLAIFITVFKKGQMKPRLMERKRL